MNELDALYAFLVAAAVAGLLTPVVARLATRLDAVSRPSERGLAARGTPLLGGLAIRGAVLTVLGLVAVMNIVNFSDGIDGLAAGVCTISAAAFAIIAFDLQREAAGVLAALTAGAALGFLFWNFHPASVFMGDSGSNLL